MLFLSLAYGTVHHIVDRGWYAVFSRQACFHGIGYKQLVIIGRLVFHLLFKVGYPLGICEDGFHEAALLLYPRKVRWCYHNHS